MGKRGNKKKWRIAHLKAGGPHWLNRFEERPGRAWTAERMRRRKKLIGLSRRPELNLKRGRINKLGPLLELPKLLILRTE